MPYRNGEFYVDGLEWNEAEKEILEELFEEMGEEIQENLNRNRKKRGLSADVSILDDRFSSIVPDEFKTGFELKEEKKKELWGEEKNSFSFLEEEEEMLQYNEEEFRDHVNKKKEECIINFGFSKIPNRMGRYNQEYSREEILKIAETYRTGGCFVNGELKEKVKFGEEEVISDQILKKIQYCLPPPFVLEEENKGKYKNNFVLCVGMNRTLNPEQNYKIAKTPVFSWRTKRTSGAFAFRAFYDLGFWVAFAVPEGYVVFDLDHEEDVEVFKKEFRLTNLYETPTFQTNNGFHLWYRDSPRFSNLKNTHYKLKNGYTVTIRKNGSYVILLSHWPGREFIGGYGDSFLPVISNPDTYPMAYFSSRFWVKRGECAEIPSYLAPMDMDNTEKTVTPTPEPVLFIEDEEKNNHTSVLNQKENELTENIYFRRAEQKFQKLFKKIRLQTATKTTGKQTLDDMSNKLLFRSGIQAMMRVLPNNVLYQIEQSKPERGKYDSPTHAIVNIIQRDCKNIGKRHSTFLRCGSNAGRYKLCESELFYILNKIATHTNNVKQSCETFLRGYLYGAINAPSQHIQKMQTRPAQSKEEGEKKFAKKQLAKLAKYILSLNKIPNYITSEELKELGFQGNLKGLGQTDRISINGKQKRVRLINRVGIRKLKFKKIHFNNEQEINQFAEPSILFKGIQKQKTKTKKCHITPITAEMFPFLTPYEKKILSPLIKKHNTQPHPPQQHPQQQENILSYTCNSYNPPNDSRENQENIHE